MIFLKISIIKMVKQIVKKVGENYANKRSTRKTKNQFLYFEIL